MEKINLASNEEITRISSLATEKKSGIPFIQNGERRILNNLYHTLVVGEDDVQKDNKIITPMIEQIISAEESFVINAKSNNLYKKFESELKRLKLIKYDDGNIVFDKKNFKYDAYVARLGYDCTSEYSLIDKENDRIVYIYLQFAKRIDIRFDSKFLPDGYHIYGDCADNYTMY